METTQGVSYATCSFAKRVYGCTVVFSCSTNSPVNLGVTGSLTSLLKKKKNRRYSCGDGSSLRFLTETLAARFVSRITDDESLALLAYGHERWSKVAHGVPKMAGNREIL